MIYANKVRCHKGAVVVVIAGVDCCIGVSRHFLGCFSKGVMKRWVTVSVFCEYFEIIIARDELASLTYLKYSYDLGWQ